MRSAPGRLRRERPARPRLSAIDVFIAQRAEEIAERDVELSDLRRRVAVHEEKLSAGDLLDRHRNGGQR